MAISPNTWAVFAEYTLLVLTVGSADRFCRSVLTIGAGSAFSEAENQNRPEEPVRAEPSGRTVQQNRPSEPSGRTRFYGIAITSGLASR
jgi:hypothetical protein